MPRAPANWCASRRSKARSHEKGAMKTAICALLLALPAFGVHAQERVTVFAAASLKNALDEVVFLHKKQTGVPAIVSYGASSALARQIDSGAPADLFISADLEWMDYLEKKGLLAPGTRRNLLGNRLVLVAPSSHPVKLQPAPGFPIKNYLDKERL